MDNSSIYADIAARTDGNIYIGVVGPVRTGKSTFIKRFMETLVIPNIENVYVRERTKDELPQSGSGRTIMTAEPKFVPEESVSVELEAGVSASVRLIDSVGFMIPGATGQYEDGSERMVTTPWFDHEVTMSEAAEQGTRKVIGDHSTIGIVVTTDGSITEIPREDYLSAEERVISELKAIDKPFLILLNSRVPESQETKALAQELQSRYDAACIPVNCQELNEQDISAILKAVLLEFSITEVGFQMPEWMDVLPVTNEVKTQLFGVLSEQMNALHRLRDARPVAEALSQNDMIASARVASLAVDSGRVLYVLEFPRALYYSIISRQSGLEIHNDGELISVLTEMSVIKKDYDHIRSALEDVRTKGYGVVMPTAEEMHLEEPEIVRQGGRYGVRLKASASSIHMLKANIETEVSPELGGESASSEILGFLLQGFDGDVNQIWESNIFGKSLYTIAAEGLETKIRSMPEKAACKLQETLQRIINDGSGTLICIIL